MTILKLKQIHFVAGGLLVLLSSIAYASDWKLAELMQLLAQQKGGKANFIEKKYIAVIDKPLESSGELAFTAPDRLEKRTLKPRQESIILEGDSLFIERANKLRLTLRLQDHPEAAAFVESIRSTLSGDRNTLEQFYTLDVSGNQDKWQLVLVPKKANMLNIISKIRIGGTHADVRTIEFEQADGDRSEMLITKVEMQ